jgi:hypothetical protein
MSGLYTATWGAFKDGPYEGFRLMTFQRSICFSVLVLLGLCMHAGLRQELLVLPLIQVFFLIMGIERLATEVYKACFRISDQSLFAIPQHMSFFGRPVKSRAARILCGASALWLMAVVICLQIEIQSFPAFLLVSFLTGCFICSGGAYKDAPFEGFQPGKFFRSALVLSCVSPFFCWLGPTKLGFLIYMNGGLERMLVEYYKSYVVKSVPGKFREDLEVREGPFLWHRHKLHYLALSILVLVAILYTTEVAALWRPALFAT